MLKIQVQSEQAAEWVGWCKAKLRQLKKTRRPGSIFRKLYYIPDDNVTIEIIITDFCDTIRILEEGVNGFLFHPRTGEVLTKEYDLVKQAWLPPYEFYFPYVNGTGWDTKGNILPGDAVEYPLVDDDHGTRNISRTDNVWSYKVDPPENYGNVDWKGLNTAKVGQPSTAPILTWKGPQSRYFATKIIDSLTGQSIYGNNIYQNGELLATAPGYVLGAALTTDVDNKLWKVCIVSGLDTEEILAGLSVLAQGPTDKIDEWHTLFAGPLVDDDYQPTLFADVPTPFFFNASGTEASSVFKMNKYTVTVDINNLYATIDVDTDNFSGTGSATSVTDAGGTIITYVEDSTFTCAIDYEGDTKIEATVHFTRNNTKTNAGYFIQNFWSGTYDGHPFNGSDNYTAQFETRDVQSTMSWSGGDYTLYSEIRTSSLGNYTLQEYSVPPGYYAHVEHAYGRAINIVEQQSNAILFMDLRNDILITAKKTVSADLVYDASWDYYLEDVHHRVDDSGSGRTTGTSSQEQVFVIIGETTTNLAGFDDPNFVYVIMIMKNPDTPTNPNYYLSLPSYIMDFQEVYGATITSAGTYTMTWTQLLFSNQPIGSWAVDRDGNHFYSMLYKNGVFNYLSGGDDPVLLTETVGANPVFFPIAPV